jgi:DNA-binding transcriptional LysR family regulator
LELLDWTEFEVLAAELNFRRAAAQLGISQPSLTRRIRRLEHHVGTHLFERYPKEIRLTPAGQLFRERAPRLSREFTQLKADLAKAKEGIRGRLSVSFFTSLSSEVCRRVLQEFRQLSDFELDLCEATPRQQIQAVRQFRIDLALTVGPIADLDLNSENLWIERLVAVLPADHALSAKEALSWPDFADERLVLRAPSHDHWVASYIAGLAASAGHTLDIAEYSATRENMIGLVRAGFGIALFPESSLLSLNTGGLLTRPMTGPVTQMEIVGVWLPENANPALRRFLETITLAVRESQGRTT